MLLKVLRFLERIPGRTGDWFKNWANSIDPHFYQALDAGDSSRETKEL